MRYTFLKMAKIFAPVLCTLVLLVFVLSQESKGQEFEYTIKTTWNNDSLDVKDQITLKFNKATEGLRIDITAPFYNDPLPNSPPGRFDGLWDYEVVEAFFLGPNEKYLELEFGPGQHYLAYYLEGVRNVTNPGLIIQDYNVSKSDDSSSWSGTAVIPTEYFPPGVNSFNAYAIHGQGAGRIYSALFPVGKNEADAPNFHLLSPFQPIDMSGLIDQPESQIKDFAF